ncbi:hypothetical protein Sjap_010562 [Stephania japonica]|uniref:Choline kinase n=1 Tax=Stephania japonica TaxID=461633 RepID=A0AAP0P6J3_9MAGN
MAIKDRIPAEAKEMLSVLASKWEDVIDPKAFQVKPLSGAMTNEVFQINWPTENGKVFRKVLVRIYGGGVELFFDREAEILTFQYMSRHELGPRLLGQFKTGRIEEFIHARTLSASDLHDPEVSALIACKLKEFHNLDMDGPRTEVLWNRLRDWLGTAKDYCSSEEAEEFCLNSLDDEISMLEKELSKCGRTIGFCHNDLQYGNIMIEEETRSITIIDYEYASYNPVAYDLANHFCEMVADYHSATPHVLDFNKYPGLEERQRFVRAYMSSSGNKPSDEEVLQLVEEAEKYAVASHLYWGLWGIISKHVSGINFEYMDYARQRFTQYRLRKAKLLGSS